MTREKEGENTCEDCGKKITERAASTYNGLCKKCYQREEGDGEGIY